MEDTAYLYVPLSLKITPLIRSKVPLVMVNEPLYVDGNNHAEFQSPVPGPLNPAAVYFSKNVKCAPANNEAFVIAATEVMFADTVINWKFPFAPLIVKAPATLWVAAI